MRTNRAFTVVETVITIAIIALISVPLYFVLSDSSQQANIVAAKDHIKREGNKVFKILENDLTQAKLGSFSQGNNEFSIKIRTRESEKVTDNLLVISKENHDATLKYTFEKPNLYRTISEGKSTKKWLVSSSVDSIIIDEPSVIEAKTSPGKLVVNLVMKSDLVGIKEKDQPTYEQNKIIVMMEDAASVKDPNWLDVGTIGGVFQTSGNLLKDLKEQFVALGQDIVGVFVGALGDIKGMTVDQLKDKISSLSLRELKNTLTDIKATLNDLNGGLEKTNKEISNLGWQALYKQMEVKVKKKWFGLKVTSNEEEVKKDSERKEKMAQGVKDMLSGYKNIGEMNWDAVRAKAGNELTSDGEDALKAFYDAKKGQFEALEQVKLAQDLVNEQLASVQ